MRLISAPLSLFAKKVEIALAEKGVACERVLAAFTQTEGYSPRHPEVIAHNPKRQVPVLIDGDLALYDSTVIIEYLEDLDPRARARCRLLELYGDEIILPPLTQLMHRNTPGARDHKDWAHWEQNAVSAEEALAGHYAKIDEELSRGDYLCGAFSAADISVFLQFFYAQRLGAPSMRPHPRLWDWFARVKARASVAPVIAEVLAFDAKLSAPVDGAVKDFS